MREIKRDELSISRARPDQLLGVLDRLGQKYNVDLANLTREQKLSVIEGQHRHDLAHLQIRLRYGLAVVALLVIATAFSVYRARLPPPATAEGTAEAHLSLEPQSSEITANLQAETEAHISPGGWAILSVYVNDEPKPCKEERVYPNRTNKSPYHMLKATCAVTVMANRSYSFRAVHTNYNADAQQTMLSVSYSY
jgi:hypothetical protein